MQFIIIVILLLSLIGCNQVDDKIMIDNPSRSINKNVEQNLEMRDVLKFENTGGIDFSEVKYILSEKEKDVKLEEAIAKEYGFEIGTVKTTYYYNRIDLDGDNALETFVYLTGSYFCGSGGCSAAIFESIEDGYKLVSRFTLVNNPIIISNTETNGWKNIIIQVSGGGVQQFFAQLKFDGTKYPLNPTVQPKVETGTNIEGTAIISDDLLKSEGIQLSQNI